MKNTLENFLQALKLTGINLAMDDLILNDLGCPHEPRGLPDGMMAVYAFQFQGQYLKIGKAGARSNARFRHQHYSANGAGSTLAKSLLNDPDFSRYALTEEHIESWIKQNVWRQDILLQADKGPFVLNFLEAFLHCAYQPKYEGFVSQRS